MLITLAEAARIMGIESEAVKRPQNRLWELLPTLIPQGFPAHKLGNGRWRVHKDHLIAWLDKNWSKAA